MGLVKRNYSLPDFDLYSSSRTVKETLKCFSVMKSSNLALELILQAFEKVTDATTKRKKIDCKAIIQEMCSWFDERDKFGYKWIFTDNSPGDMKFVYAPIVKGGDIYNLNRKEEKSRTFEFDVIYFAVAVIYKNYHSVCFRTMLINPTERAERYCIFLKAIEKVVLYYLRHGVELHKVYESAISFVENEDRNLLNHLHKKLGFKLNHHLKDDFIIRAKSKSIAEYGMTFALSISFLKLKEGKTLYNLNIVDTVLVRKDEPAEILTRIPLSRNYTFIEIKPGLEDGNK